MRVFSGRFWVGVAAASVALLAAEAFPPLRAQEEAAAEAETFPETAFADVPAFADALESCWNESADALKRMRRARWETTLPADEGGRTLHSAYWRGGKIWGIEAEQIKIEEEKGRAVRLEIMFFNKGATTARRRSSACPIPGAIMRGNSGCASRTRKPFLTGNGCIV